MTLTQEVFAKNTLAFIETNPSMATVVRRTKTATPEGGYKLEVEGALEPQLCRVIFSGNQGSNITRTTPDGRTILINATAMFMPGADIERDDFLFADDKLWEVGIISTVPLWRVTAELSLNG